MKRDPIIRNGMRLLACMVLATTGQAWAQQGQSMEERLRAQLRATTEQLQQAQNELAAIKLGQGGGKAPGTANAGAAGGDAEALRKEVASLKSDLAAARSASRQGTTERQQAQAALTKANEQVTQYRGAYENILKLARSSEGERQRLAGEEKQRQQALAMCADKNTKLYSLGKEILQAYETMDIGTVIKAREPFAAESRVKYEQIAQEYGDKLYEGRFDARAVPQAPAAAAGTPTAPAQ